MDNTCRSIIAEAVFANVNKKGLLKVCSRGLAVLFPEPVNPKAVAVLKGIGLSPLKESSQKLEEADLREGTIVLTMTEKEKRIAGEMFPGFSEIYSIAEFKGEEGKKIRRNEALAKNYLVGHYGGIPALKPMAMITGGHR